MWIIALGSAGALTLAGAWIAYLAGVRRGRAVERAAANRHLHDRVLPALDALALATPSDATRTAVRLAELRRAARAQAADVRRHLEQPSGAAGSGRLGNELDELVAELARDGLRAKLVLADIDDTLPAPRRTALRDATREALRNTLRHARTNRAEVRVEPRDGGIAVITRDRGIGFDTDEQHIGFGIEESIVARMIEVGGRADIHSRPGWGTRVSVWVPL